MELGDKTKWRLSLGDKYFNEEPRNVPAAVREFRRVTQLAPDWTQGYLLLATALEESKQIDEAISTYRAAMRVAPEDIQPLISLSRLYIRKHESPKAIKILRRAISINRNNEEANQLLLFASEKTSK